MNQLSGKVIVVGETKEFGSKGFRKREIVIEDESGQFTQFIPVDLTYENCDMDIGVGDSIEMEVLVGGRKWEKDGNTRYFPSITFVRAISGEKAEPTETTKSSPF